MEKSRRGVIFDMDGVIIDSEPLWKRAEKEVFSSLGVQLTDEWCELTKSMTTSAVTQFWFEKFPWPEPGCETVEQRVISRVIELIHGQPCAIRGAKKLIEEFKARNYLIGLATNAPAAIIPAVLQKLDAVDLFDTIASAEFESKGKPDPSVYLSTLTKLGLTAEECIAIEDSYSGAQAAQKAGLKVVFFTNGHKERTCDIATIQLNTFDGIDINCFNLRS